MEEKNRVGSDSSYRSGEAVASKDFKPEAGESRPVTTEPVVHVKQAKNRGCWWAVGIVGTILAVIAICAACSFMSLALLAAAVTPTDPSLGLAANEVIVREGTSEGKIAVIHINGIITQGESLSPFGGSEGAVAAYVINDLVNAYNDENVKAVILSIESPGGEAVASDIIYQEVKKLSAEKPVVVYSSNMVASGGYMIAMGGDYFMTHEGAITGSIGVILQAQSLEGLYEKLGIETATFKSGDLKDNAELFDDDPNGELDQVYQELVDETYESFVSIVAEGRSMNTSQVRILADGRVYSGKQSVGNGLIDETGYINDAYDKAEELAGESGLTVVEYSNYDPWADLFGLKSIADAAEKVSVADQPGVQLYYLLSAQ